MAGGDACEEVTAQWSGGTGESFARTVSGRVYSMGPVHANGYRRGRWCTCEEKRAPLFYGNAQTHDTTASAR